MWQKQWNKTEEWTKKPISDKKNWDVIVIGAGMAGILTAYYLQKEGKQVLVLEADAIASGQTGHTTAKITSQHDIKYSRLVKTVGEKIAGLYARANEDAIAEYERLIQEERISCGFERVPAYLYTCGDAEGLQEEARIAASLGVDACFTRETELPFPITGAVCFRNQAQFFPLEFVSGIASALDIREHTRVLKIRGHRVVTEKGVFTARDIVLTTHYPFKNVPGFYFLRQHQERSYVLALSGCKPIQGMYYGVDADGISLRQAGEYLLLGGGSHRTGKKPVEDTYTFLECKAAEYFPQGKEEARWSAQDCMPHDGLPFIGRYSIFTPHLYVATGFQKWGMTTSCVAAMLLRDLLQGKKNPYERVFSPQRLHVRAGMKAFLQDVGMSTKGLWRGFFHRPQEDAVVLACGQGGIVTLDGERYACYRDERGKLHKISPKCPHLGCELAWNEAEKSWDCPCHGSRFDVNGNVLDNPANQDAGKKRYVQ